MERLLTSFAVGSPGGPRSGTCRLYAAGDGEAILLAARAGTSRFTATVQVPHAEACRAGGDGPPLSRESLRQAVAAGRWATGDDFVSAWPGRQVATGVCELFSVWFPASALRAFAEPEDGPEPRWIPAPTEFGLVNVSVRVGRGVAGCQAGTVLGRTALSAGREAIAVCSLEEAPSRLQKMGLFGAIRKRRPPDVPQGVLAQPDTRLVLVWQLDGRGVFTEIAGDMFFTPGSC